MKLKTTIATITILCIIPLAVGCAQIGSVINKAESKARELIQYKENISDVPKSAAPKAETATVVADNIILQESEILAIIEGACPNAKVTESAYDRENFVYNAILSDESAKVYKVCVNAKTGEIVALEITESVAEEKTAEAPKGEAQEVQGVQVPQGAQESQGAQASEPQPTPDTAAQLTPEPTNSGGVAHSASKGEPSATSGATN